MNKANQPENKLNRTRIARIVFAAAESMGIADRKLVERLTSQVIERLEQQPLPAQPLPGMEDLVPKPPRRQIRLPADTDILTMVEEILTVEELKHTEEAKTEMEPTAKVKTEVQSTSGITLSENALHVLEKRYLKKDKQGQVIETPEEMFRRVAQAIASAELIYDAGADVKAR